MEQKVNKQHIICYDACPVTAVRRKKKAKKSGCKMGRPKKHWTKQVARQRKPDPKRLRRWEVDNLKDAANFASRIGLGFTFFISLRWYFTALGEADIKQRWQAVLNHLRTWATRQGFEFAACWAHENPPRSEPAFNTHIAAHIPPDLHEEALTLLAKKLGGLDTAVHGRPYVATDIRYFCKGTDMITAKTRGTIGERGWQYDQGEIPFKTYGKRAGCTQNIGRNARQAFYAEKYPVQPMSKSTHPQFRNHRTGNFLTNNARAREGWAT